MPPPANDAADHSELKARDWFLSRRQFLCKSTILAVAAGAAGCKLVENQTNGRIIDIHQHTNYSGRPDDVLLAHQRTMGITKTILLPAGRPVNSAATHDGVSNGLEAKCTGNEACYQFARAHPGE